MPKPREKGASAKSRTPARKTALQKPVENATAVEAAPVPAAAEAASPAEPLQAALALPPVDEDEPPRVSRSQVRVERDRIMLEATRELNLKHAVATIGGGTHIFTRTTDELGGSAFVLQSETDLALKYKNRRVTLPRIGRGGRVEYEVVSKAKIWVEHPERWDIDSLVYRPGVPADEMAPNVHNIWDAWGCQPIHDSGARCKLIRRHLFEVLCGADERLARWMTSWLAQMLQAPNAKPGTSIVLRSKEGTGKGLFFNGVLAKILAGSYLLINQKRYLVGNFNSVLQGKLFCVADEPPFAGDKETSATLRSFVTEPNILIEFKKREPYPIANPVRVIFLSNLEWVVEASDTARRWCVSDVSDKYLGNREYFDALEAEIRTPGAVESFFGWLLDYDISGVDLRTPPVTEALLDQKIHSLDSAGAWWYERLWSGELHGADDTLADGRWPETITNSRLAASYHAYCKRKNIRYPLDEPQLGKALRKLGAGAVHARRLNKENAAARPWGYQLSDLCECRGAFEGFMGGPIDWPSADGGLGVSQDRYDAIGTVIPNRADEIDNSIPF